MTDEEFEQIVAEEFSNAIPEKFRPHIKNVAFLISDEPSPELRAQEGLRADETLLGHYHGIPYPLRGEWYGMGATLPDTITLFRLPIEEAARERGGDSTVALRRVVRETLWHEIAHHFGFDEKEVEARERERGS